MKNERIIAAYDGIAPDTQTLARVFDRTREAAAQPQKKHPGIGRKILIAAACVAAVAALSGIGYGVYTKWHLPEPETYPFNQNGAWDIHETADLTLESIPPASDTEPLTDEYFAARAKEILTLVGQEARVSSQIRITRQEHLTWAREEVEVRFSEEGLAPVNVTFDAESGTLLNLNGFEWKIDQAQPCKTKQEAEALAAKYYEMLPVPQGYVLRSCTEFDENYWSFDFCRDVGGIYSYYEDVRIGIDPQTGTLNGLVVFYVPLLDDHQPSDVPLTQQQAQTIAEGLEKIDTKRYTLQSAEVQVVLPNWWFTDSLGTDGEIRASKVSRLGWVLVYEDTTSEFADMVWIYIDYYTGEVLGGDMTG